MILQQQWFEETELENLANMSYEDPHAEELSLRHSRSDRIMKNKHWKIKNAT